VLWLTTASKAEDSALSLQKAAMGSCCPASAAVQLHPGDKSGNVTAFKSSRKYGLSAGSEASGAQAVGVLILSYTGYSKALPEVLVDT
jgi:hypothetical protein